ncbi:hypothetical protein [Dactylosporangium sp. CA-233914]|uniref:hypothetical protein n=1 Tax=Dactylosporangium sp. CA-233914 TaxID=3239934 RepID=UPI003D8ED550
MSDLDALRQSLHEHAEATPPPIELLAAVHRRSRGQRRRRVGAIVGAAAATAFAALVAGAVILPDAPVGRPAGSGATTTGGTVAASGSPAAGSGQTSGEASARPPSTAPARSTTGSPISLGPPAYTLPAFPFEPGVTPAGGLAPPVVTLDNGRLTAYFEAKDPRNGADVTISVSAEQPTFTGAAHEATTRTRERPATLRTVAVKPAAQLTLYWRESSTQWVRIDTDDTLTAEELVAFADALRPAAVPVPMPFRLELAPVGLPLSTVSKSTVAFRGPSGTISCTLTAASSLDGATVRVGPHRARATRTAAGVTLVVLLEDRGESLVVQVPAPYTISDADLVRFAGGVSPAGNAEPAG